MRVVFDTNIFVSAFAIPGSLAEQAILKIIEGKDVLLLSREILDELLSVMAAKFSRNKEEISRVALLLDEIAEWIKPDFKVSVLKDESDNRVLGVCRRTPNNCIDSINCSLKIEKSW